MAKIVKKTWQSRQGKTDPTNSTRPLGIFIGKMQDLKLNNNKQIRYS